MNATDAPFLAPGVKQLELRRGRLAFAAGPGVLHVPAPAPEEAANVKALRRRFGELFPRGRGLTLRVAWRADVFADTPNAEQAYRLRVGPRDVTLVGGSVVGAQYGLETLGQLAAAGGVARATVRDWPDVAVRVAARPLLCGEACRQALDWGDGRAAWRKRWRREIDFALACRYNAIFCSGFDWSLDKYPGFAGDLRGLNRYARARGVRLFFGGYGIGTGGWGGDALLGEAHDFVRGLGGGVAQGRACCRNNPQRPETGHNGTCRAHPALRAAKVDDLARFLRAVEPGGVYIHHEDLNRPDAESVAAWWGQRCPACRARWPDDRLASAKGGAAALADGFDAYGEAAERAGARDCLIVPMSPFYGDLAADDAEWAEGVALWTRVGRLMRRKRSVCLGFREQMPSRRSGRPRLPALARRLRRLGLGTFVFTVGGADLYVNDAPFSAAPAANRLFAGATALFSFSGVLFQRPQQLFNSECAWNLDTPAYRPAWHGHDEAWRVYESLAYGAQVPGELAAPGGWLDRACRLLYGEAAGEPMFRYHTLHRDRAVFPMAVAYFPVVLRKLFARFDDADADARALADEWRARAELTAEGRALVARAATRVGGAAAVGRDELAHQARTLAFTADFAAAVADVWALKADGVAAPPALRRRLARLRRAADAFCGPPVWPGNGDAEGYAGFVRRLEQVLP